MQLVYVKNQNNIPNDVGQYFFIYLFLEDYLLFGDYLGCFLQKKKMKYMMQSHSSNPPCCCTQLIYYYLLSSESFPDLLVFVCMVDSISVHLLKTDMLYSPICIKNCWLNLVTNQPQQKDLFRRHS